MKNTKNTTENAPMERDIQEALNMLDVRDGDEIEFDEFEVVA